MKLRFLATTVGVLLAVLLAVLLLLERETPAPAVSSDDAQGGRRSVTTMEEGSASSMTRRAAPVEVGSRLHQSAPVMVLRDVATRLPLTRVACFLEPVGGQSLEAIEDITDESGCISVPAGLWRAFSPSGAFVTVDDTVSMKAETGALVWVQQACERSFRLRSTEGLIDLDVRGTWTPSPSAGPVELYEGRPDQQGVIAFRGCPSSSGIASFSAPGHCTVALSVRTPPTGTVEVWMSPTTSGKRSLAVVSMMTGEPVYDVEIVSTETRSVLAESDPQSNIVTIPEWVDGNEQLTIRGSHLFPSVFRLRDVAGETLRVWEIATLSLSVQSLGESSDVGMVWGRYEDEHVGHHVRPLCPVGLEIGLKEPATLELPKDCPMVLEVIDANGRSGVLRTVLSAYVQGATINLSGSAGGLEVRVLGEEVGPLASATGLAITRYGRLPVIRADGSGVLYAPAQTQALEIEAPGFVKTVFRRSLLWDPTSTGVRREDVTLVPSLTVEVVVIDSASRPIAGIGVKAYPANPSSVPATSQPGWRKKTIAEAKGTTNGEGRVSLQGLPPGEYSFRVEMPALPNLDHNTADPLYTSAPVDYRIAPSNTAVTLQCSEPRPISLSVFEETTRLPVRSFEVRDVDNDRSITVDGHYWEGWVRSSCQALRIWAPGVGAVDHRLPLQADSRMEVFVPPENTSRIAITGLPDTESVLLNASVYEDTVNGRFHLATVMLERSQGRDLQLALPFTGQLFLGLNRTTVEGTSWAFLPKVIPWQSGGLLEFRARPATD